jgi:hypothetical protein
MSDAKKRLRKDAEDAAAMKGGKVAASALKGLGEAPALGSTSVPPVHIRRVAPAATAASAAVASAAVVPAQSKTQPVAQAKPVQASGSSLFDVLRGEFRKRQLEIPTRFATDDSSMAAAMHLAETLYVDQILRETSGNVSLAGKMAKIT